MLNKEEDLIQCRKMERSDGPEGAGESAVIPQPCWSPEVVCMGTSKVVLFQLPGWKHRREAGEICWKLWHVLEVCSTFGQQSWQLERGAGCRAEKSTDKMEPTSVFATISNHSDHQSNDCCFAFTFQISCKLPGPSLTWNHSEKEILENVAPA